MLGMIPTIEANRSYSDDESIVCFFFLYFTEIMSGKNDMFYISVICIDIGYSDGILWLLKPT